MEKGKTKNRTAQTPTGVEQNNGGMRELTLKEVENFASKPKVRRIAVENFLYTVTNNPNVFGAYMNLDMDARLYRWNRETIKAIKDGIRLTVLRD